MQQAWLYARPTTILSDNLSVTCRCEILIDSPSLETLSIKNRDFLPIPVHISLTKHTRILNTNRKLYMLWLTMPCALILYRRRRFINHLLTYLFPLKVIYRPTVANFSRCNISKNISLYQLRVRNQLQRSKFMHEVLFLLTCSNSDTVQGHSQRRQLSC